MACFEFRDLFWICEAAFRAFGSGLLFFSEKKYVKLKKEIKNEIFFPRLLPRPLPQSPSSFLSPFPRLKYAKFKKGNLKRNFFSEKKQA